MKAEQKNDTFIQGLINSIFEPGVNPQLKLAMNVTFVALILSLLLLIYVSDFNMHAIFLFIISILLFGTIQWFLAEMKNLKPEDKKETEVEPRSEIKSKTTKRTKKIQ